MDDRIGKAVMMMGVERTVISHQTLPDHCLVCGLVLKCFPRTVLLVGLSWEVGGY